MPFDNAFTLNEAAGVTTGDESRQRKLKSLGSLRGLFNEPTPTPDELSPSQPLYGGEVSKDTGTSEGNEPSALATERVGRAPVTQEASPLLNPEQRAGNLVTGEQGQYGPLTGEQRTVSLKDFFQPVSRGEDPGQPATGGGGISRDVGGAGTNQNTGLALSAAKTANKAGTSAGKSVADLFKGTPGVGEFSADFPGQSFAESERLAAGGFNDFGLGPTDEFGDALSRGSETVGGAGSLIGPIGAGVGGALSIASLINSIVGGQTDTSRTGAIPNTAISAGTSALPLVQSLIGPAAGTGLTGLSGIGLAYTPLLIPAIKSLVDLFKEPNFPEVAGQKTHGLSDYQSALRAEAIVPMIQDYINQNASNPSALLSLAMNSNVNPEGEVTYTGSPLQSLAENPTDEALRQFISSAGFGSGATGRNQPNALLSDNYRRTLAHALNFTPEQAQGLFGPEQYGGLYNALSSNWENSANRGWLTNPDLQSLFNSVPDYANASDFQGYSPYYRDPSLGQLSPDQIAALQAKLQGYMQMFPKGTGYAPTQDVYYAGE